MPQIKSDIIINPGSTSSNTTGLPLFYKDLREWGSITANTADKQPIIQQAIDDCLTEGYRRLYIPTIGQYHIQSPLIVYQLYSGNYVGITLEIFGDGDMWDSGYASYIKADFTDSFIIGIQNGKGCKLKGLSLVGGFVPPAGNSYYEYYRIPFDQFTDGISRDSRYSPNAAIVIDPFTRGGIPSDGGYPNLSSWYQGTGGQNGSTSTTIDNCIVSNTVVGICSSPNGVTRNAEITTISNTAFRNHKLCISGGQDQEKANTIYNTACWYNSHTFFATGKYGSQTPGNWNIDTVNIAGQMVQFIDNDQQQYSKTTIKKVYAEGLGRWGFMQAGANQGSTVTDCFISFAYASSGGLQTVISGDGVFYDNCTFRYYGTPFPMFIAGESVFSKCTLSGFPVFAGQYWYPRFINCRANGAFLGLNGIKTVGGGNRVHPYGDFTLQSYNTEYELQGGVDRGLTIKVKSNSQEIYTSIVSDTNIAVVSSGMSLTFTSANASIYFGNGLIKVGNYWAVVTAITGNVVTASYSDPSFASGGSNNIVSYHPIYFTGVLVGDIVSGQNQITNCRNSAALGWTPSSMVGTVIKNPYGGSKYLKITDFSNGALTFYGSVTATKAGAVFGNYATQEIASEYPSQTAFPSGYPVRRGDKIISQKGSENSTEYIVTKGGFLSGDTDIRQAQLQIAY